MNLLVEAVQLAARAVPARLALGVYGFPRLAGAVRGLLNLALPGGFQQVRVTGGPLAGCKLVLDLRTEKYLWFGTYEPWVQAAVARHLPAGAWAWDVGAFIGYHTLLMHRLGARVVSLEPDPANRQRLERHLELNGASDVLVLPYAAGDRCGTSLLARVGGGSPLSRLDSAGQVECEVVTLDSLLGRLGPPRLVKVDIEGGEAAMMRGAARLLHEVRPVWVLEVHGEAGDAG